MRFALAPLLIVILFEPANGEGAVAIGEDYEYGYAWGYSLNQSDKQSAANAAIQHCQRRSLSCRVRLQFQNNCFAIAETTDASNLAWGYGTDASDARKKALGGCAKHRASCRIVAAECDTMAVDAGTVRAQQRLRNQFAEMQERDAQLEKDRAFSKQIEEIKKQDAERRERNRDDPLTYKDRALEQKQIREAFAAVPNPPRSPNPASVPTNTPAVAAPPQAVAVAVTKPLPAPPAPVIAPPAPSFFKTYAKDIAYLIVLGPLLIAVFIWGYRQKPKPATEVTNSPWAALTKPTSIPSIDRPSLLAYIRAWLQGATSVEARPLPTKEQTAEAVRCLRLAMTYIDEAVAEKNVYTKRYRLADASKMLERSLALDPSAKFEDKEGHDYHHDNLAGIALSLESLLDFDLFHQGLMNKKERKRAITAVEKAIRYRPYHAYNYYVLTQLIYATDPVRAKEAIATAYKYDPDNIDIMKMYQNSLDWSPWPQGGSYALSPAAYYILAAIVFFVGVMLGGVSNNGVFYGVSITIAFILWYAGRSKAKYQAVRDDVEHEIRMERYKQ